jgi:hypothetical protein
VTQFLHPLPALVVELVVELLTLMLMVCLVVLVVAVVLVAHKELAEPAHPCKV